MSDASKSNDEHSSSWWNSASWTYPASQGTPSRISSRRNPLLRISSANRALRSRIVKYLTLDLTSGTIPDKFNKDLVGIKVVEEALEGYEADAGFSMLDRLLESMSIGWVAESTPLYDVEPAFDEYRDQWDDEVEALLGNIFERIPEDESLYSDLSPEDGEERLKDVSPLWDSCLSEISIIELARAADIIDLTDSELSADSDPLPVTPKPRKYSLTALSPSLIKPLNATASSFIPSPAKFTPFHSPPSSPSPSPSPPVLDIVNFPTLRQTILSQPRKDGLDGKPKWGSKRPQPVVPSFLTEKTEGSSRRSKTRQMVDKMRSASDARKPDADFILMTDEVQSPEPSHTSPTGDHAGPAKGNKKRARRGRDSASTDNASVRSSSAEGSGAKLPTFASLAAPRPQNPRPPPKHAKRTSNSNTRPPITVPTPPTPAFSSPAASVSSFGGPVTPASFGMPFHPPPPPPHPAYMHMNGRSPPYGPPPPFPYPYYSNMPGNGMMPPPTPFNNSYPPYPPYNAYANKGVGLITGASGIRHASW